MNEVRVYQPGPPLQPQIRERFGKVAASAIGDCLERCFAAVGLHAIGDSLSSLGGAAMVGPALTVRTRPGDNLAVHKALDLARPGDVVVVDARGELVNAILGDLMASYARVRGIAGLVVDGAIRDRDTISRGQLPVYARGVSPLGPYKSGPGEIHGAVSLGGVATNDGDVIVGDGDGVIVVPRARAEETLAGAEGVMVDEERQRQEIETGSWDRAWLENAANMIEV